MIPCEELRLLKEKDDTYSAPMPWIGVYVAVASLICTLAMAADVFHGFRHRKLWFPCKYFTLNAASLTVIAVTMKLPVDLTTSMPGYMDQLAKASSMAFMCIMLANFMPSQGDMGDNELLLNIIALGILVITIFVNVCIQIRTGVINDMTLIPVIIFLSLMLFLLIISVSLAIKVPVSKKILEWKYDGMHKRASTTEEADQMGKSTEDKLMHVVRKYWIMAETGDPQFMMASSPSCSASGAISIIVAFWLLAYLIYDFVDRSYSDYCSDFRWSVIPVVVTQTIGVVVGAIAPTFRLFAALSFKLSVKWSKNYINVFHIESYWTKLLVDWKHSRLGLQIGDRKTKKIVDSFKILILNFFIGFQIVIVVSCKIIRFIPICFVIFFVYCHHICKLLKRKLMGESFPPYNYTGPESEQQHSPNPDLSLYVLQLQDEVELARRTLKTISNSANRLIQKAEKQQPTNLINLLKKSSGNFAGVAGFDDDQVLPLHSEEAPNCWSLVVVTLTSIAIALPNLRSGSVDCLLRSVSEGLFYVKLVEENLNAEGDLPKFSKAAYRVWLDVELYFTWFGIHLQQTAQAGKVSEEVLRFLGGKARSIVMELRSSTNGGPEEEFLHRFLAANSMYRISQTILLSFQGKKSQSDEELFELLSIMIADILAACLTNFPQIILMKCYTEAIERRKESVRNAARLLGQSMEILKFLQELELPSLEPEKTVYLDHWCDVIKNQRYP